MKLRKERFTLKKNYCEFAPNPTEPNFTKHCHLRGTYLKKTKRKETLLPPEKFSSWRSGRKQKFAEGTHSSFRINIFLLPNKTSQFHQ